MSRQGWRRWEGTSKDVVSNLDKSRDYVVIPSRQFIPSGVLLVESFRQVPQELHTRH